VQQISELQRQQMATRAAMDWLPNRRRACMKITVPATAGTQQPLVRSRLEQKATGHRDHHSGAMRETAQVSSDKGKGKNVYACTRKCARCPPVTSFKRGPKEQKQKRASKTCARACVRACRHVRRSAHLPSRWGQATVDRESHWKLLANLASKFGQRARGRQLDRKAAISRACAQN
jgi:hypothetical protein